MSVKKATPYIGIAGLALLAVGGVSYAVAGEMSIPIGAVVWAGVLLSIFFVYVSFTDIKAVLSGKSLKYGANAAVMIAVFAAILAMIGFMSIKYKTRADLTATKRYTLSEQTRKLLKSLKEEIEVISFYRSDERTRQQMEDLLQSYALVNPKVKYWFIDPDKKPGLAEKYGVTSYRTTLVKSGGRQENVSFESEERLTNAIVKVTRGEVKTVYFLTGHGENALSDDQKTGYKAVKEAIEKENLTVKEVSLFDREAVPTDASVLVVSGPKKDLLEDEFRKIKAYADGGGAVLFMIDPYTTPALASNLSGWGFKVGNDIIVDTLSKVFGANYLVPVTTDFEKDHPVTADFSVMTFFPLARSVEIERKPEKGSYTLAATGTNSWGETDRKTLEDGKARFDEGKDRKGPVPIASVTTIEVSSTEGKKKFGKVAVIGDSDFVNNTNINLAGNRDFFLNTVSWLAEEADLIAIRKKAGGLTPVILTSAQGRLVFWAGVVIPPTLIAVFGIAVLARRRKGE